MVLARDIAAAQPVPRATAPSSRSAAGIPCMARAPHRASRRPRRVRIWILGRGADKRPPAQQLATIRAVQRVVARRFQSVKVTAVGRELGAEVAYTLVCFFLLGWVELLLGEGCVFVDGALEGG